MITSARSVDIQRKNIVYNYIINSDELLLMIDLRKAISSDNLFAVNGKTL